MGKPFGPSYTEDSSFENKIPALEAWDAFSPEVRRIIEAKSKGYGSAWQVQGYMGNLARVLSKSSRLKNILWNDNTGDHSDGEEVHPQYESLQDTLRDLAALCAFMASNIEEGNRWGN